MQAGLHQLDCHLWSRPASTLCVSARGLCVSARGLTDAPADGVQIVVQSDDFLDAGGSQQSPQRRHRGCVGAYPLFPPHIYRLLHAQPVLRCECSLDNVFKLVLEIVLQVTARLIQMNRGT